MGKPNISEMKRKENQIEQKKKIETKQNCKIERTKVKKLTKN